MHKIKHTYRICGGVGKIMETLDNTGIEVSVLAALKVH